MINKISSQFKGDQSRISLIISSTTFSHHPMHVGAQHKQPASPEGLKQGHSDVRQHISTSQQTAAEAFDWVPIRSLLIHRVTQNKSVSLPCVILIADCLAAYYYFLIMTSKESGGKKSSSNIFSWLFTKLYTSSFCHCLQYFKVTFSQIPYQVSWTLERLLV